MVEGFRAEGLCFLYLLPCEVSVSGSKARLLGLGLSGSKHLYQNADAGGPPKLSTKPRFTPFTIAAEIHTNHDHLPS